MSAGRGGRALVASESEEVGEQGGVARCGRLWGLPQGYDEAGLDAGQVGEELALDRGEDAEKRPEATCGGGLAVERGGRAPLVLDADGG